MILLWTDSCRPRPTLTVEHALQLSTDALPADLVRQRIPHLRQGQGKSYGYKHQQQTTWALKGKAH
jgi:hypothetical protein